MGFHGSRAITRSGRKLDCESIWGWPADFFVCVVISRFFPVSSLSELPGQSKLGCCLLSKCWPMRLGVTGEVWPPHSRAKDGSPASVYELFLLGVCLNIEAWATVAVLEPHGPCQESKPLPKVHICKEEWKILTVSQPLVDHREESCKVGKVNNSSLLWSILFCLLCGAVRSLQFLRLQPAMCIRIFVGSIKCWGWKCQREELWCFILCRRAREFDTWTFGWFAS